MDDHALLAEFVDGNTEAFAELVRRYAPVVRAAALRQLADEHRADDVTQSTMMLMMRKARRIPRGAPLGPWLLRVAHDLAIDSMRSETARRRHERLAAMQRHEIQAPSVPSRWQAWAPVLDQTLHTMGIEDRTILTLRYLQGWSIEQVAGELGLTPAATRQRLSRAVRRLRTLLARRDSRGDDEVLPAVALPPMGPMMLGGSFSERLLVKASRLARGVGEYRKFRLVAGAIVIVAGPVLVILLLHHRPPPSRPPESDASPRAIVR
jgi:RNA polymerase sigma-70 factor (ECF subfamily)